MYRLLCRRRRLWVMNTPAAAGLRTVAPPRLAAGPPADGDEQTGPIPTVIATQQFPARLPIRSPRRHGPEGTPAWSARAVPVPRTSLGLNRTSDRNPRDVRGSGGERQSRLLQFRQRCTFFDLRDVRLRMRQRHLFFGVLGFLFRLHHGNCGENWQLSGRNRRLRLLQNHWTLLPLRRRQFRCCVPVELLRRDLFFAVLALLFRLHQGNCAGSR